MVVADARWPLSALFSDTQSHNCDETRRVFFSAKQIASFSEAVALCICEVKCNPADVIYARHQRERFAQAMYEAYERPQPHKPQEQRQHEDAPFDPDTTGKHMMADFVSLNAPTSQQQSTFQMYLNGAMPLLPPSAADTVAVLSMNDVNPVPKPPAASGPLPAGSICGAAAAAGPRSFVPPPPPPSQSHLRPQHQHQQQQQQQHVRCTLSASSFRRGLVCHPQYYQRLWLMCAVSGGASVPIWSRVSYVYLRCVASVVSYRLAAAYLAYNYYASSASRSAAGTAALASQPACGILLRDFIVPFRRASMSPRKQRPVAPLSAKASSGGLDAAGDGAAVVRVTATAVAAAPATAVARSPLNPFTHRAFPAIDSASSVAVVGGNRAFATSAAGGGATAASATAAKAEDSAAANTPVALKFEWAVRRYLGSPRPPPVDALLLRHDHPRRGARRGERATSERVLGSQLNSADPAHDLRHQGGSIHFDSLQLRRQHWQPTEAEFAEICGSMQRVWAKTRASYNFTPNGADLVAGPGAAVAEDARLQQQGGAALNPNRVGNIVWLPYDP
jgi:hypothetical protein